jgi:sec-independent protein translocase protein TatB
MFDFAWTEIALIGIVALIAIGPKDLPVAIKAVASMIKKARKMAGEFQTHVDEMVREANLDEVRSQISQIRNLDIKGTIERAVDNDGSIRKTFTEDPLRTPYTPPPPVVAETIAPAAVTAAPSEVMPEVLPEAPAGARSMERPTWLDSAGPKPAPDAPARPQAPAFIPPAIALPPVPPAFLPPNTRLAGTRPAA